MRYVPILLMMAGLLAGPAFAQMADPSLIPDPSLEEPLEGEVLSNLFEGHTHRGYYQYGAWVDRDPAFIEQMDADGTATHDQDGKVSVGTWRTRHNVVCFDYTDMNGGCFNMFQRGNCYFAFSAMTEDLVAVTVLDGESADCEPSFA